MTWHIALETVRRYQSDAIDRVGAASVEAHLASCNECRPLLVVDGDWLERSWMGVADRVEPGRPNLLERGLILVRVPQVTARLVAVSPALRASFLLAVILVMGFAVAASNTNPAGSAYRIFLVVAPLVPVVGVAFAYGRLVDPAFEMAMVSPIDSFRVLTLRAGIVLTTAIILGLVSWPLVPAPTSIGASAWLLPALGLTLSTLALASRFEMWLAGAMVGGSWVIAMLIAVAGDLEVFDSNAKFVYAGLAVLAGSAVVLRRSSYDREKGGR